MMVKNRFGPTNSIAEDCSDECLPFYGLKTRIAIFGEASDVGSIYQQTISLAGHPVKQKQRDDGNGNTQVRSSV